MPRFFSALTVLIATLVVTSACVHTAPAPSSPADADAAVQTPQADAGPPVTSAGEQDESTQTPYTSKLDAGLMYRLLLGEMAFNSGDQQEGSSAVLSAAQQTGDEALYKRATEMAIQAQAGNAALRAAHAWRVAHPDSAEASRYELQVLLALGRIEESESALQAVVTALPDDEKESFILALPAIYQRAADPNSAAEVVDNALDTVRTDPVYAAAAWTTIGRMRLQANDHAGALSAATRGQEANSSSQWPALLGLQILADDKGSGAERLITKHLASADADPEVRFGYIRVLIEQDRIDDARHQADELVRLSPDFPDGWMVRGMLLADKGQDTEAEESLKHFLDLAESSDSVHGREAGRNRARLTLSRLALRRADEAESRRWLDAIDSAEPNLGVEMQRALLLARDGKLEQARKTIQSVPERDADDARMKILAEAQLLRDHDEHEASWQLLSDALQDDPDDEGLLYDAAMAAERLDRLDDMERLLRRLIELAPEASHAYNALGYSLADRGLRLGEARQLIEKAAALAPDDAYIQDSLGWVEFRLGNTLKARRVLRAAYDSRPDPEIAAHLGEVLWTLGRQDEATTVWRAGLELDPQNKTLLETMRRLGGRP